MAVKSDKWIRRMALEKKMIEPFSDQQVREGVISYGLSSYGYDVRIADEFKIFTNINSTIVDPKHFDPRSFVDFKGDICIIPPNSFALARTVEYFRIPRNVITVCVGKCVAGDTQVLEASTGRLVPIADLAARPGSTATLEGEVISPSSVTEGTWQGVRPVYEVVTATGRSLRATSNHPLLTFSGWRRLGALRLGDRIGVPRRIPIFGTRELPPWEVDALGRCVAESASPNGGLRSSRPTTGLERGPHPGPLRTSNGRGEVDALLDSLEPARRSPGVPQVVFELRAPLVARFLRVLFSSGGTVREDAVEFCSSSQRLAHDVQHLLLRFGVVSSLCSNPAGGHVLSMAGQETIGRFAEKIGFAPGSGNQRVLEEALEGSFRSNRDTLPREAWSRLEASCERRGATLRTLGVERSDPSLPRDLLRELAFRLSDEDLGALADSDVLWDTVVEKRPAGMEAVYDLTLPETANFLANDVVVHNSTYARCGIIVNVTPFEPEWEGIVTLEVSNTTPLPAKIYAGEGIAQVLFFESDEVCETSYADKKGKYQGQKNLTLPKL
jgi:deoxycytidine triphosphate deaminase